MFSARPAISKRTKLASRCAPSAESFCRSCAWARTKREGRLTRETPQAITLDAAYATCRAIAKREAKNFYYAFVALPEPRRNAICAIYAFMRKADDLSDDESIPREQRLRNLEQWQAAWHELRKAQRPVTLSSLPSATPRSASTSLSAFSTN